MRALELAEARNRLFRIRAGVYGRFVFVIVGLIDRIRGALGRRNGRVLIEGGRVDEVGEDVAQLALAVFEALAVVDQRLNGGREGGERTQRLVQALLDALGDLDLALAGQQVNRAHLPHVHAHGIGGAAELAVERGQGGGCFLGVVVIVVDGVLHH